jgi:hypothetical protein
MQRVVIFCFSLTCRVLPAVCCLSCMLPVAKAQSLESALEIVEKAVTDGDIPGATVLVIRDGKTVAARAVGICDRKQQRAFRNDTICWIASLTKRINSVTGVPAAHWSGGINELRPSELSSFSCKIESSLPTSIIAFAMP